MMLETTPSQTVGPFFSFGLCVELRSELVDADAEGALTIAGRLLDGAGEPVPDGVVEIWQADRSGAYRRDFGWGRCPTDEQGEFRFLTVKPGPVAGENGGMQAPHLTVLAFARGLLKPVLTRIYFPDEQEANQSDPVLAAIPDADDRASLIASPSRGELRFDIRLQGDRQTVFFVT
ncbi:MAG: protocatechuate 3,4-dioxygenase subunit alpha [Gaiellaceae bacterium]